MENKSTLFQSPDERGGYCDAPRWTEESATIRKGFNPLTSGAGTATLRACLHAILGDDACFNPLTSGAGTATAQGGSQACSRA